MGAVWRNAAWLGSLVVLAASIVASSVAPVARADGDDSPLPVRVNEAVDRAAANLVKRQNADGSWQKDDAVHPIGRTALCTYALLHAGYAPDDEPVRRALKFLGVADGYATTVVPRSTYEAGCLLLLLHALGRSQDGNVRRVADWLVEHVDPASGLWGYPSGSPDLSNTQYAVLGLKVASLHGHEAPERLWERLIRAVMALQAEGGAFRYRGGEMYGATMTHAALLVLRFAHEALGRHPDRKARAAMDRGAKWVEDNFRVDTAPFGRGHIPDTYYYYMYGLERYAVIFGLDRVGGHDWYREGAEALLARRSEDWSWGKLEDTAFAILFLRKVALTAATGHERGERNTDDKFPAVQRDRPAADVAPFAAWLVAGPFRATPGEDDMLLEDHVDVAHAKPVAGGKAGKMRWEVVATDKPQLEFGDAPWCSRYCAAWIVCDVERDAVLWLGCDDGARGWWNGAPLPDMHHHGPVESDAYRFPVRLAAGRNLLVLQVENTTYGSYVAARISAPDGSRLPASVVVTTDPRQ